MSQKMFIHQIQVYQLEENCTFNKSTKFLRFGTKNLKTRAIRQEIFKKSSNFLTENTL